MTNGAGVLSGDAGGLKRPGKPCIVAAHLLIQQHCHCREKPKDVIQYLEEEGVVKLGEFDIQVRHCAAEQLKGTACSLLDLLRQLEARCTHTTHAQQGMHLLQCAPCQLL
jgi:hypothetical protein